MLSIDKALVAADAQRALAEDLGSGDVTAALLPAEQRVQAILRSREPMLVCGQPWVEAVCAAVDPELRLDWLVAEGAWLPEARILCRLQGRARSLLTAERSALNFLQTLSGTATQTRAYVQALQGLTTRLLDTRKTLPGLRYAQKYAVACAGGSNHRMGLYDAFLIKENHIKACGSISEAILRARQQRSDLLLEVEVETLDELQQALAAAPDRVMLDNFSLSMIEAAVAMNRPKRCPLEVSGGIDDLDSLKRIAQTGVDFVSVGALTKSVRAIDLSLLIESSKENYG